MNNMQSKVINFLGSTLGWLFGGLFILMSLVTIGDHPIASLIAMVGAALMLPPIYRYVFTKSNFKAKKSVVAIAGFFITLVAIGSSSTPTEQPQQIAETQPKPQSQVTATTVQPSQNKEPSATPVVVPVPTQSPPATPIQTSPVTQATYDINCKVVGISDGDTFTCLTNDKQQIKVRMNQIDAPESKQDFGQASKQALSGMIFGKVVGLKTNGTDKYGRTIAEAFYDDKNINKAMVEQGMAWAYREYMTDNEYASLETTARSNTTGLWSQPNPTYPSDFRRMGKGQTTAPTQTQEIATTIAPTVSDSGASCGSKRYCKQMATCAEARHYLNDCGVSRLDRDGDGVPCESICN